MVCRLHPGTAKGKLVNALKLLADIVAALPRDALSPETTEEREGFVHPNRIEGGATEATLWWIVRDHDDAKLDAACRARPSHRVGGRGR